MDRLIEGYRAFKAGRWPQERAHYEELAKKGQKPAQIRAGIERGEWQTIDLDKAAL